MSADSALTELLKTYLGAHHSMTLATASGGQPWAAAVFFVHDDRLALYFLSDRKARHSKDLEAAGAVAAAINEDPDDWRQIRGVQLEGRASRVSSPIEKAKALALYVRKFPFVKGFFSNPADLLSQMRIAGKAVAFEVYKLTPVRMYYLDNQRGFSNRAEVDLGRED